MTPQETERWRQITSNLEREIARHHQRSQRRWVAVAIAVYLVPAVAWLVGVVLLVRWALAAS